MTTSDGPSEPVDFGGHPDSDPTRPTPVPQRHQQGPPPPAPFSIVHVEPAQGSDHARADGPVIARFSGPVSESTLTPDSFQLYRQGTDIPIPATVLYDPPTQTATLQPESSLERGGAYTAVVRGGLSGVCALSGPVMPSDVAWSFTTGKGSKRGLIIGVIIAVLVLAAILVAVLATRGGGSSSPSVQPESVDFGDQAIGQRSGSRSVQVTNSTNDAIVIRSVGFTGADAGDFVLAGARTCVAGASVAKDDSCTAGVSFAPTKQGNRTATLAIALNDGTSLNVALSGTGTGQATAVASTSQLSFGSVTVGGASATQQATITNTGNAPLPVQTVSLGGANAGDFTIAKGTTCVAGTPVPASGNCVVAVSFAPAGTGDRSGTLSVASGAAAITLQIALSGSGVGEAQGALTPSQASFGSEDLGSTSKPTTFTLKNSGDRRPADHDDRNPGRLAALVRGDLRRLVRERRERRGRLELHRAGRVRPDRRRRRDRDPVGGRGWRGAPGTAVGHGGGGDARRDHARAVSGYWIEDRRPGSVAERPSHAHSFGEPTPAVARSSGDAALAREVTELEAGARTIGGPSRTVRVPSWRRIPGEDLAAHRRDLRDRLREIQGRGPGDSPRCRGARAPAKVAARCSAAMAANTERGRGDD